MLPLTALVTLVFLGCGQRKTTPEPGPALSPHYGGKSMESRDSFSTTSVSTTTDWFFVKSLRTLVFVLTWTMENTTRSGATGDEKKSCSRSSSIYLMQGTKKTLALVTKAVISDLKKNKEFEALYLHYPDGDCSDDK